MWRVEEEGGQVELLVVDRHEGDMAVLVVRSWVAWGRRLDHRPSSSTVGFGSPPQTCRSWWWT